MSDLRTQKLLAFRDAAEEEEAWERETWVCLTESEQEEEAETRISVGRTTNISRKIKFLGKHFTILNIQTVKTIPEKCCSSSRSGAFIRHTTKSLSICSSMTLLLMLLILFMKLNTEVLQYIYFNE